jgi:hypothetical protein
MPDRIFKNAGLVLDGPEEMVALLGDLVGHWNRQPTRLPPFTESVAT